MCIMKIISMGDDIWPLLIVQFDAAIVCDRVFYLETNKLNSYKFIS